MQFSVAWGFTQTKKWAQQYNRQEAFVIDGRWEIAAAWRQDLVIDLQIILPPALQ